ncbi:MAG TPA: RNA methyltransferase [Fibrobacteria bacterium]|nr:RNA methyltransferase [Fibrobacteria bacterium]HOX52220.1 RNA methyltransferase [Fibrobacteria bacterium]
MSNHRLILVQPEIPENIGFVVRAMACFGWTELAIVGAEKPTTESVAYRTATLGKDILDRCTVHDTLQEAFGQARTSIAFTRRPHQKGLIDLPNLARRSDLDAPWALVFGRESIGLTSEEVLQCDFACRIPTAHSTGSLNLGQAVAVALSGLFATEPAPRDPAKGAELAMLREDWVRRILAEADSHLHPARQEAGRRHLAALLRRLRPTRAELRFLGGLLERMSKGKTRAKS